MNLVIFKESELEGIPVWYYIWSTYKLLGSMQTFKCNSGANKISKCIVILERLILNVFIYNGSIL